MTHKTVFDDDFKIINTDYSYNYQADLTSTLDNLNKPFDQQIINEIVLWKVNRFAFLTQETLDLLNLIDPLSNELDVKLTAEILKKLLLTKGIQLAMASTILRFRNKNIYQIIDQRVYRIIYKGKKLKLKTNVNDKNIDEQIELYLQYIKDLTQACEKLKIEFNNSDRVLYEADKRINKHISLDNY